MLQEYNWPGNVRELKNLMERIVIMNPQVRVDSRHIPSIMAAGKSLSVQLTGSAAYRKFVRLPNESIFSKNSKTRRET